MAILGSWITTGISASTLNSAARSSSVFVETFLEPAVQDMAPDGTMAPGQMAQLDALLADTPLRERLISVKVWRTDGTIIYSTDKDLIGRRFDTADVDRAASGEVVASFDALDNHEGAGERETGLPLIEIYAPLHSALSGEIVAIGEYYEHAAWLAEDLERTRLFTWAVVGATTAAMIGILYLLVMRSSAIIASQRQQLDQRIAEADLMASQNEGLRAIADKARLDASEANEQLLGRIGADLHDGPIQMLSLLTLRLSAEEEGDESTLEADRENALIAQNVLTDLRTISAGLVLPEIAEIDLRDALQLAVLRHEGLTGTKVVVQFSGLPQTSPLPLRTCAYRVVQEALNNAHKHARNARTEVSATVSDGHLHLMVSDSGPGMRVEESAEGGREQLGLAGIRNRVNALRGEFFIDQLKGGGTSVNVLLPIDP